MRKWAKVVIAAVAGFSLVTASCIGRKVANKENMVWIKGGTFRMGSNNGLLDEMPDHQITLSWFYMDKTEVTQADFEKVMGNNPSDFKNCPTCPVENVKRNEAKAYCEKVGKRLPTEAEWEYAARAGSKTKYYWGDSIDGRYAWYDENSDSRTHPVGQKKPNGWGLYDMIGNVSEWCSDYYSPYSSDSQFDPQGASSGEYCVYRGGSWHSSTSHLRSAYRGSRKPSLRLNRHGFRCVAR